MYYEMTTKVTHVKDDGTEKDTSERYITDCETFAEAEERAMISYSYDNTDGDVIAIKRSNVREIVNENEAKEHYFKATIVDTFIDDKTEKEKELRYYVLIRANDLGEATAKANEYMRQGLGNMKIEGLVKTRILELLK